MANPITCQRNALSRSLDVTVNLSRPSTEIATDMTMICFVTPDVDFPSGTGRVRFFSSFEAVQGAVPQNSEAYFAANAFFARQDRPSTMAIGRVFTEPTAAELSGGTITPASLAGITDGAFDIEINGQQQTITGLAFDSTPTLAEIASILNTALSTHGVTAQVTGSGISLSTTMKGDGASLGYALPPTGGSETDISGLLALNASLAEGKTIGYTPGDLVSEINLIRQAARCSGRPVYGWVIDRQYRDTPIQKAVADWAEAITQAYFSACTNAANAYNAGSDQNIGAYAYAKGLTRTSVIYYYNPQLYPDMSYIACALSTDYAGDNTAKTMKFKEMPGFEPDPTVGETELPVLESRNINCYVAIGNTSVELRPGTQSASTWFTDSRVNLDNYVEELQVEVYNVFKRNPKVSYTTSGQDKLVSAATKINNRYIRNGVFADRDVEDDNELGYITLPATTITPVPIYKATASERASRAAPPIAISAYEASAMHGVTINVDVYN